MVSAATDPRAQVAAARRLVIKVGSSSLTTGAGRIDLERIHHLVDVLASAALAGRQLVLVSSGAIASGLAPLGLASRPTDLATAQAAASVGQGELVAAYSGRFGAHGLTVGQILLSADDIGRRAHYRNAQRTLERLLELGVVPIVNENDTVATDEIKFGDNDRLAALVAHLVHADGLVLLSDVDALYDGPPGDPASSPVREVRDASDLDLVETGGSGSRVGSGGMRTKVQAARLATDAGVPVVLSSVTLAGAVLAGGSVGTVFHPTGRRRPTRLLWLKHGPEVVGRLVLDAGAVAAIATRNASLLPAGIVEVTGTFEAGDPVELVTTDGVAIARGIVSFDSDELPELLGRRTAELAAERGSAYDREVVHRDDLIMI
ncbi:MAG: glutamate 5-kinase [Actinomycetes bacterium]|jgi:glutamate 5-kinase